MAVDLILKFYIHLNCLSLSELIISASDKGEFWMKKIIAVAIGLFCLGTIATQVLAEDNWHQFSVSAAETSTLGNDMLNPEIKFYMKGQGHPKVIKRIGEYKSNKRTNGFGKSAQQACDRAFISALASFQDRALKEGGNAVIDIYSITKDQPFESAEEYSCLKGGFVTNVALMGTVATLSE